MIALVKYHFHLFLKSGRFFLPFLLWTFVLFFVFHDPNSSMSGNMLILLSALYVCMAMVGYAYMNAEQNETAADQVMIFHTKSMLHYNFSKNVFLCLLSFILSVYGGGVALLFSLMRIGTSKDGVALWNLLIFVAALWLFASAGAMQGAIWHPRLILNKAFSLCALMGTVLLTFIKVSLMERAGNLQVLLRWLLPPNSEIMQYFGGGNLNRNIGLLLLWLAIYSMILPMIQCILLERKRY